ncbi:MAG TPA: PTS sugar transporter subunit IIA [Pirellulales bacterium]|nr:PTS sugar transporter subunit IIA [Pirellulales bacterium]
MDKTISSRTPEGAPNRCPVCGNSFCIQPSTPPGDAPCPHCGSLAWFGEVVLQSELRPLVCDTYLPELRATDQEQAIREIVAHLASAGKIERSDEEPLVAAILKREELGSTGIGRGFAVPHAKHRSTQQVVAAMALSPRGIEFNSLDGRPVHVLVLVLSPADDSGAHLRTLERVSRCLRGFIRER